MNEHQTLPTELKCSILFCRWVGKLGMPENCIRRRATCYKVQNPANKPGERVRRHPRGTTSVFKYHSLVSAVQLFLPLLQPKNFVTHKMYFAVNCYRVMLNDRWIKEHDWGWNTWWAWAVGVYSRRASCNDLSLPPCTARPASEAIKTRLIYGPWKQVMGKSHIQKQ